MEKQILFRASSFGNLMTESKENSITENQLKEIDDLTYEMENGINANGNKVKWTENKASKLQDLINKRDAPPKLSQTAKSEVKKIWRQIEKGFIKELDNKYIMKGLFSEQDAIELISDVEGHFYIKNSERITKGHLTGEVDIKHIYNSFEELPEWRKKLDDGTTKFPLKVVKDTKCSYDLETFMNAEFNLIYETQGDCYLYLEDYDEFHLHYCLVDCPPHIYENEVWKIRNKYGITDPDTPEAKPLFDQLRRNLIYSDNPNYTKEERVKNFFKKRDKVQEEKILSKIPMAVEFYKTIETNKIY